MAEPHSHEEFEVDLVVSGRGTCVVAGERRVLRPRTLIWLCPDQEHILQKFTNDFTMWIVVVSPEFAQQMAVRVPILGERDPGAALIRTVPSKCARLLDQIAQELSTGFQPLDCHQLGLAWWLASAWNAYQYGDSKDAGSLHSAVARAMALLREDPSKNLKALSEKTRISPSQLSRLFKRQVGISITDYRNRLRLDAFVERCDVESEGAMFELARDSGFGSYAQFSRVFRRQMGICPEKYYRTIRHEKQTRVHLRDKATPSTSIPI